METFTKEGWERFGTIGFDKYLSFLLDGTDAGVDLETVYQ